MCPLRLSQSVVAALAAYDWPGNVRELERLMERAVTLSQSDVLEIDDLPPWVQGDYAAALLPSASRNDSMRAWASRYARLVLERCRGNKRATCRILDISYHTLQAYLRYPLPDAQPSEGLTRGPDIESAADGRCAPEEAGSDLVVVDDH